MLKTANITPRMTPVLPEPLRFPAMITTTANAIMFTIAEPIPKKTNRKKMPCQRRVFF